MRGKRHIVMLLVVATGLLVLPTVEVAGAPPTSDVTTHTVDLQAGPDDGDHRAELATDGVVSVAALLDQRRVELRWRSHGVWSEWHPFPHSGEHAPDPGMAEAASARPDVSEPVWIGDADSVELRADAAGAVEVELVTMDGDREYDATVTPAASADALAVWPPIIPRYRWDPRGDCAPTSSPRTADSARRIYVHHTVIFPHYEPEEGDDVIRAICLGHVNRRGFSDVGYNFLIDAYGRIYQGRVGGILQPVVGAHAQGFNQGSIGIALVGDFETHRVPAAAVSALDQLTAWLADLHGIEPYEVSGHVSTGGKSTRFDEGEVVELPTIVGHRDTALDSACPGDHLYAYVRGRNPMAPRVRAILRSEYGWPETDLEPPQPGKPKVVSPSAGAAGQPGRGPLDAVEGLVGQLSEVVGGPPAGNTVRTLVRGAEVASEVLSPDPSDP